MARERHDAITRTELFNLFSRNKTAREIERALQAPIDAGLLERATVCDARSERRVRSCSSLLWTIKSLRPGDTKPRIVARLRRKRINDRARASGGGACDARPEAIASS